MAIMRPVLSVCRLSKVFKLLLFALVMICTYFFFNRYPTVNQWMPSKYVQSFTKDTNYDENASKVDALSGKQAGRKPSKDVHEPNKDLIRHNSERSVINIVLTFKNAAHNHGLQDNFRTMMASLFKFTSVPVALYLIGDEPSQLLAAKILKDVKHAEEKYKLVNLDIESLARKSKDVIKNMQSFFSYKPGAYYSDVLFFLSIFLHKVLPDLGRVIMMDVDLKFNADIKTLHDMFNEFSEENIIGIARENSPVYRHTFHMYRNKNKGTRVGDPPPHGLTGFNSGVVLLDLDKMRSSELYNSLLNEDQVRNLTEKFMFKGHLGDQDFFSLLSMEYEELFYVLPCTWNRQLCTWWKKHGYESVWDLYFRCEGHINIYHGNCNTPIPKLEWEN